MIDPGMDGGVRHRAWGTARQALLFAESASPALLVVTGPAGSGKTRFLADLGAFARVSGMRIAPVDAADAAVPLLAVDRLTRELGVRTDNLPSDIERLHGLRVACQRASAGRPGVLIIVDHADQLLAPDRSALVDLVVNPPSKNLLVALALPSTSGNGPFSAAAAWAMPGDGRVRARRMEIELAPLTADEILGLAESRFGIGTVATRFADSVAFLSAGLMTHVDAILSQVAELEESERQLVFSGSEFVEQSLVYGPPLRRSALGGLFREDGEEDALLVARGLGAWVSPAPIRHLAPLLELDPRAVERQLGAMQDRGAIVPRFGGGEVQFAFATPLARLEVVRDTPELIRRHLHARAAMVKEDSGWPAPPAIMAQHYLLGHVDLTPDRLSLVTQAAQTLTRRSRYARAQRMLREALAQLRETRNHEELPAEALALFAETLSRSGESDEAERILVRDAAFEPPTAESVIRRARDYVARGQDALATSLLEAELASEDLDPAERLQVMVDLGRLMIGQGRLDEGERLSAAAYAEAVASGEASVAIEAEVTVHARFLHDGLPRRALEHGRNSLVLAHRYVDERLQARTLSAIGNALTDTVGLPRAFKWLQRARERAESAEDFATLSWTTQLLAVNCIERGDWMASEHFASNAVHIDDVLHRSRSLRLSAALQHWLQALRGNPVEFSIPALGQSRAAGQAEAIVFQAACESWLLTGHAARALGSATEVIHALEARPGNRRQLVTHALPAQARIAFELRDAVTLTSTESRLRALLKEVGREHGLVLPEFHLTEAMLHAVRDEWELVPPLALRAASGFGLMGYRRRAAAAQQLAGDAYREVGETDLAHLHLTDAFIAFRGMGAVPRMDAVRRSLHLLGRRAPRGRVRPGELTARQRQIATHAAEGKSDREIAATLGIRYRTVTTHMSNILHVLGLTTRSGLSEWISGTN